MKTFFGALCAVHPALKGLRFKSSRLCVECNRIGAKKWRAENPNYGRKVYAKHKEKIKARENARYAANPAPKRASSSVWRKANRDKRNAYAAKRRAGIAASAITIEDRAAIIALYAKARAMTELSGEPYHVDHIKPLSKGGLHHPNNLQVLRGITNLKKGVRAA